LFEFEVMEMRSSFGRKAVFASALIFSLGLLLFHASLISVEGTASAQDPNASLPSTKKTPPANKSTPPPKRPPKTTHTTHPTTPANKSPLPFRPKDPGLELVRIPSGSFTMGSATGKSDEKPTHEVRINYSFFMGRYEVTQAQWQSVMGGNPSYFKDCGGTCPVEYVSWDEAQSFITKLNELNDKLTYRLPSEAEWEYACRAGTVGDFAGNLDSIAWYGNNSGNSYTDADIIWRTHQESYFERLRDNGNTTHAVGTKQANGFGLYDMLGNVLEWCQDWYHETYTGAPTDGSAWLSGGEGLYRVLRGGSWFNYAASLRSAERTSVYTTKTHNSMTGFRVVGVARTQ
jgi:formylglycine-generating enzyme required for sulfatase activity